MHGLGIISSKNNENEYGLWENGNRVIFFDSDCVNRIQAGSYDYSQHFTHFESHNVHDCPSAAKFEVPSIFTQEINRIKYRNPQLK